MTSLYSRLEDDPDRVLERSDLRAGIRVRLLPGYGRSQTEMCFGLSVVNGERSQSAQRS